MAEQRKAGGPGKAAPFVASIVKDPKSVPRVTLLCGYLGDATDEDRIRIYFDPELTESVDILRSDVLHVEDADTDSPLAQSYVWVRAEADARPVASEPSIAASYLSGRISEENLGATYAQGIPGIGATPALAPSVFTPLCPTRFPPWCPTRYPSHCPTLPWFCRTRYPLHCPTRPWVCRTLQPVQCRSVLTICPTLSSIKCQSLIIACEAATFVNCPSLGGHYCPQPSAAVACPTFGACPSAVDACPSAPGGCTFDPTIVFDPGMGGGFGAGGGGMWG
jgi:hypothetical protein